MVNIQTQKQFTHPIIQFSSIHHIFATLKNNAWAHTLYEHTGHEYTEQWPMSVCPALRRARLIGVKIGYYYCAVQCVAGCAVCHCCEGQQVL